MVCKAQVVWELNYVIGHLVPDDSQDHCTFIFRFKQFVLPLRSDSVLWEQDMVPLTQCDFFLWSHSFNVSLINLWWLNLFFAVIFVLQASQNFSIEKWVSHCCCYSLHLLLQVVFFQLCLLSQLPVHDACILHLT